ncbi:hypothetical protein RI367_004785 [Sorochytrium milnesiophthora]
MGEPPLVQWLAEQGMSTARLAIHHFEGDTLVTVPHHLLITRDLVSTIFADYPPPALRVSEHNALAVFLALVAARSSLLASDVVERWMPYVQSLPTEFSTMPATWKADVQYLPTYASDKVNRQKCKMESDYKAACVYLKVVNTRCISLNADRQHASFFPSSTMAIAPFLDMLNHSSAARISVLTSVQTGALSIVTRDAFTTGEQVFIHYGSHKNWDLLVEYGFAMPGNTHDVDVLHVVESYADWRCEEEATALPASKRMNLRERQQEERRCIHQHSLRFKWDTIRNMGLYGPFQLPPNFTLLQVLRLLCIPDPPTGSKPLDITSAPYQSWVALYERGGGDGLDLERLGCPPAGVEELVRRWILEQARRLLVERQQWLHELDTGEPTPSHALLKLIIAEEADKLRETMAFCKADP